MEKQISHKNMLKNVINKGFAGTYTNKRSITVTAVTPTSIYIPEEKNMEVLHIKNPQTRERTVTFVTFLKNVKKPSKYKGLSGNKTVLPKISSLLRSVTERSAI